VPDDTKASLYVGVYQKALVPVLCGVVEVHDHEMRTSDVHEVKGVQWWPLKVLKHDTRRGRTASILGIGGLGDMARRASISR
jgi:hypothetical protein